MFWVIDRAPRDEDNDPLLWIATGRHSRTDDMAKLISVLESNHIAHRAVCKPPMADYLVDVSNTDLRVDFRTDQPVFAYGSTTMHLVSKNMGWEPGFIDGPTMIECNHHWGDSMLNFDASIEVLGTMAVPEYSIFIRPVDDGKSFAGTLETPQSFSRWREQVLDIEGWTNIPPETRVVVARPCVIETEWRLAVVDGLVVTSSLYRDGHRLRNEEGCPKDILQFANDRLKEWQPRSAFILDIAATERGIKIVETNSISSAGFYAMDMERYVHAIESSSLATIGT